MTEIQFPAHVNEEHVQTVKEHCLNTAIYAGAALEDVGLKHTAYITGILHDMGKCKLQFKKYLEDAVSGEKVSRGSVNHSFAGVRYILEKYHGADVDFYQKLAAEIIAFGIGAHHGQFDVIDELGRNGFEHRRNEELEGYQEVQDNYFLGCFAEAEIEKEFVASVKEIRLVCEKIIHLFENQDDAEKHDSETLYMLSLLSRLVLSSVIEGDRRDTAEFMQGMIFPSRRAEASLWGNCLDNVENKMEELPAQTEIQKQRKRISELCRTAAEKQEGVYRLNVPTGGGKTLSSLRFALAHAKKYAKQRIIFTSPLLSILDQNAKVVREFVQNDDVILEHHSNVMKGTDPMDSWEQSFLEETWDAPIIITTMAQLLNTLFAGENRNIRRFHSLCNSIIVIDEVQTIPTKMLSMVNLAVTFLSDVCNTTVVLCSATQPCFEDTIHGIRCQIKDLIPRDAINKEIFKRTTIKWRHNVLLNEVQNYAGELLANVDSLLIVCNKKSEAKMLFLQLSGVYPNCYHLSASMCMEHRCQTINAIKYALRKHEKIVCVSTQVIEAGVDISFESVIRFAAGMDSAIQAAGRCNRNGESKEPLSVDIVYVVDEDLNRLRGIEDGKKASLQLYQDYHKNESQYGNDLASDEAIKHYYRILYGNMPQRYQDYCVGKWSLFDLLSNNEGFCSLGDNETDYYLNQAFKTAGDWFTVFDYDSCDVVVPFEEGERLILELGSERAKYDLIYRKDILQKMKPFTVSVSSYQRRMLEEQRAIYKTGEGTVLAIERNYYDDQLGIVTSRNNNQYLEV